LEYFQLLVGFTDSKQVNKMFLVKETVLKKKLS